MRTGQPLPSYEVSEVTLPRLPISKLLVSAFLAAISPPLWAPPAFVLRVLGYLYWLTTKPPFVAVRGRDPTRSDSIYHESISRSATIERNANTSSLRSDGNWPQTARPMEKDYRRKRADFLCNSETQHPLTFLEPGAWETPHRS